MSAQDELVQELIRENESLRRAIFSHMSSFTTDERHTTPEDWALWDVLWKYRLRED